MAPTMQYRYEKIDSEIFDVKVYLFFIDCSTLMINTAYIIQFNIFYHFISSSYREHFQFNSITLFLDFLGIQ